MIKIQPSAAHLQLPMAQQNFFQKLITIIMTLRSTPLTRKTIFIAITICVFIIYLGPFFYRHLPSIFASPPDASSCLSEHLKQHERAVAELDAYVDYHDVELNSKTLVNPLHFVGNGKLGVIVKETSSLYLFYDILMSDKSHRKSLAQKERMSFRLPYNPMIKTTMKFVTESAKSASVINFREGIVEKLHCYQVEGYSGGCVFLNHTVIAHRSRSNVFLQHIQASADKPTYNTQENALEIEVNQEEFFENGQFTRVTGNLFNGKQYKLYSGVIELASGDFMGVAIASQISGNKLHPLSNNNHIDAMAVVMHSQKQPTRQAAKAGLGEVENSAAQYTNEVLKMSIDELLEEHRAAWKDILHTGLSISTTSKYEPGIPDPRTINATLYYVLSSSDSKLHDKDIPQKERRDLINRLQTPDFCYQGHPTFHSQSLWNRVQSVEDVVRLQSQWSLTLRKHQCKSLVSEGAEGLLQAMLLSFGGLQFTENDLRLGTDPDVLHNDIAFHSLIYRNDTLDISIRRDSGGKDPVIMVSLREPPKIPLYACEAGCILDAIELSMTSQLVPVYVTDPITSILYISHDRKHLSDLRDTLHVKKIMEHAKHMDSIRNRTGLPTIFWVGIGSLIIFFHLFLIRLICNEYKASMSTPSSSSYFTGVGVGRQSHYSSRGRLAS